MLTSTKMDRVAVTGAAGVIGRELLDRLIARGCTVLALDREELPPVLAARVRFMRVELSQGGMDEVTAFAPDTVFHLAAAFERSREESGFWETNARDNLAVTHRLHEALRKIESVRRYVFASSYLIYRPELYLFDAAQEIARPLVESDAARPRNLCGAAKYLAESEIDFLVHVDRRPLSAVSARIYRVYGRGSRDVVSRWTRSLLGGEPIALYNAQNRFDYVFAGDVAEGLVRLADAAQPGHAIVNLGTGRARSVGEVVEVLARRINATRGLVRTGEQEPVFEASAADTTRFKALTGWVPGTTIEDGIDRLIAYERGRLAADAA
ncbi:MAG: NAD-dependent epimerase/dehydratase family protein [Micropepsaceae bacterium]